MEVKDLDIIWHGRSHNEVNIDSHFQQLRALFRDKLNIQSTGEIIHGDKIEACVNEHELISLLRPNFQWTPVPESAINRFQKSADLSAKLRERANIAYKRGELKNSMQGYNLALTFAPIESTEMGLAFANRSALLVQLKKFSAAMSDITYALKNNFPDTLKEKLEQRRFKCKTVKDSNKGHVDENNKNAKEYFYDNFFKLKNPNIRIPNAESFVKIDFKQDRGRRLLATESVPAGTLILIDKPFVSVINNLLHWDPQHCHWCTKPLLAGIPCEHCTFTMYCDESCRRKSCDGSHKYEHKYLSYLHTLANDSDPIVGHKELQALRIIANIGPEELRNLFVEYQKTGNIFNSDPEQIAGFNCKSNIYDCSSYLPMYHLIFHGMQTTLKEKVDDIFKSMFLTRLLKESSDFFADENNDEFENFVTSLMLRHLWNIRSNAISVNKLEQGPDGQMSVPFATAVNPLISLCNHSCDPNAAPVKKFHMLETALVTLKHLNVDDEICITYKPLFSHMKRKERMNFLQENYNFLCACTACTNNWSSKSLKETETKTELSLHCSECKMTGMEVSKESKLCETCLRHHLQQVAKIDEFENMLYKADELIKKEHFINAIEILKPCLTYFSRNHSPCYSLSQVCLTLFKRALVLLANQAENYPPVSL